MNRRTLGLLAFVSVATPIAAASAQTTDTELAEYTVSFGFASNGTQPPTGASVGLVFETLAPSVCIGCDNNLGTNNFASATFNYTAQNSPGFDTFVSILTGTTDASLLAQDQLFTASGQGSGGGGAGSTIIGAFGTLLPSPSFVASVDRIQETVTNYRYVTDSPTEAGAVLTTQWKIYGTPGPALPAPEIDPASAAGGLTLLLGSLLVLRGRRERILF